MVNLYLAAFIESFSRKRNKDKRGIIQLQLPWKTFCFLLCFSFTHPCIYFLLLYVEPLLIALMPSLVGKGHRSPPAGGRVARSELVGT